ncbi:hypothetical protein AB0L00_19355 [Actinoallomurus sp. NPDC052308]|uniref:hypothetical protein n=1 Tax=Actinoallomurus sp. NPDC052308 TaxID=3155530 RepID=UPI003414F652
MTDSTTDPQPGVARIEQTIRARLDELAEALRNQSLAVRVGTSALVAWNPAASVTDDPRGQAMNPGLSQYVAIAPDGGSPHWYWCWTGPTRDASLETEYMCPAEEIDRAATLITKVLRVDGHDECRS